MNETILHVDGLSRHFRVGGFRSAGTLHATDEVTFEVARREIVALVGESGSGKSTIARVLAGLYPPTAGRITFEGQVQGRRASRRVRGRMPMVFQDPFGSINPVLRVGHSLHRSLKLHRPELDRAGRQSEAVSLVERVGLLPGADVLQRFPHELSGGQRQRLGFAQALASRPSLILADEPVSMLDVSIRIGLLNVMRALRDDEDVSLLYITHDLASARYVADRMIVLYAGRIVEEGTTDEVIANPSHPYTRLLMATAPDPRLPLAHETDVEDLGEPPKVIDPGPGCRFAPRCPLAMDQCRTSTPAVVKLSATKRVACYAVEQG
ncbi:MAG: ABC transporter ATP-binding protein [Acidobacteriota bacterium]|nr:ABC transporter ATP-binding protein [Acidobacteriota bacterium]MDE3093062.1 ABC transporter ATP-binding protein [Acidobacteriota bacterium]MDE3139384.1 ABC transporter ATP-binding protein [Acidobacteriota bacterium]MDE3147030.1 ABC transporter ATP-binding protein [Acidobacteriota bacterium]